MKIDSPVIQLLSHIIVVPGIHIIGIIGLFFVPITSSALVFCFWMYIFRGGGITIGYHRYFAHRSFKTSRVFQFILAVIGTLGTHQGVLTWAGDHRFHHRNADTNEDIHSPKKSFLWSHLGWIFSLKELKRSKKNSKNNIKEFYKYPELVWLNKHVGIPIVVFVISLYLLGGWSAVFWGYIISQLLVWHVAFCVNSVVHLWGTRRYNTKDNSRNNFIIALITGGEGWHNNHHYKPSSARNGFKWWGN